MDPEFYSFAAQLKTAKSSSENRETLQKILNAQQQEAIYKQNEDNLYDWKNIAEKTSKGLNEKNHHVIADIIRANIWFSSTTHNCFRSLEYKGMFEELKRFYLESATYAKSCFGNTLYNEIYGQITAPPIQQVRRPTLLGLVWLAIKTLLFCLGFILLLIITAIILQPSS